jgi:hypothetical protein
MLQDPRSQSSSIAVYYGAESEEIERGFTCRDCDFGGDAPDPIELDWDSPTSASAEPPTSIVLTGEYCCGQSASPHIVPGT